MGSINWGKLQEAAGESSFEALPPDEYEVCVDNAEAKQTSTGKDQIAVRLKVESGPHASKSLFNNFVISPENPNALSFFFRHMAALGLNAQYFQANPALDQVAQALTGRRCRVRVSIRQWQGQDRNQVDAVMPANGPAVSASPPPGTGIPSSGGMEHFQQAPPPPPPGAGGSGSYNVPPPPSPTMDVPF